MQIAEVEEFTKIAIKTRINGYMKMVQLVKVWWMWGKVQGVQVIVEVWNEMKKVK